MSSRISTAMVRVMKIKSFINDDDECELLAQ